MYPSWERPGLWVLAAPPRLLVSMAFLATMRPMPGTTVEDLEGAFRIAADADIRTGESLRRVVMPDVLGCSLSSRLDNPRAWARQAVKSRSRAAVRQRRRA